VRIIRTTTEEKLTRIMCVQGGYVHRDIRWNNVVCSPERQYFLIDLELSGLAGPWHGASLTAWDKGTFERRDVQADTDAATGCSAGGPLWCYTPASDLYQLGRMMNELATVVQVGAEGMAFRDALLQRDPVVSTAGDALQHPWLGCAGDMCTIAGNPPAAGGSASGDKGDKRKRDDAPGSGGGPAKKEKKAR
jgi:hypothetical protein